MNAGKLFLAFLVVVAALVSGCTAGDGTYHSSASPMSSDTGSGGGGGGAY
ncbi:hypothetical protein EDC26_102152 [Paralcaligenes ureilyticus]|uniref:Lipoprotein n=1 Tax=Paralcaligenes ureilyticus TaxID=627131 RepID=A0A4R3MAE0_9BURK|nr:hypothetical protein EDC26_102152 [Paralcaligenes ureilyticus]